MGVDEHFRTAVVQDPVPAGDKEVAAVAEAVGPVATMARRDREAVSTSEVAATVTIGSNRRTTLGRHTFGPVPVVVSAGTAEGPIHGQFKGQAICIELLSSCFRE